MTLEQQKKFKQLLLNLIVQLAPTVADEIDAEKIKAITTALINLEFFLETIFPYTNEAREKQLTRFDMVSKGINKLLQEDVIFKNELALILQPNNVNFSIIAALFEAKQITTQEAVESENKSGLETAMCLGRALAIFTNLYAHKGEGQLATNAMQKAAEDKNFYPWVDNVVCPAVKSICKGKNEENVAVQEGKKKENIYTNNIAAKKFSKQVIDKMGDKKAFFIKGAFNRYSVDWFILTKKHPVIAALITIVAIPSIVGAPLLCTMFINGYRTIKHKLQNSGSALSIAKTLRNSTIYHVDTVLQQHTKLEMDQDVKKNAIIDEVVINKVTVDEKPTVTNKVIEAVGATKPFFNSGEIVEENKSKNNFGLN